MAGSHVKRQERVASLGRWLALLALALPAASPASEPDFERETRLAEEIVDMIFDGDPEWLDADGREFLAIHTEADDARAAVIILHGRGFHPDWAEVVNPLRVGLAERGYSTLSLQMPVLEKEAKYYDYVPIFGYAHPRIEAGIRYLREQGHDKVVLLAHSCGAHMAMDWIRHGGEGFDAWIGIGMGATDYGQPMREPFPLDRLRVPVLDIYAARDFPAVRRMAPERKAMIEAAGHPRSAQHEMPDSEHYFVDRGGPLLETVADWLDRLY